MIQYRKVSTVVRYTVLVPTVLFRARMQRQKVWSILYRTVGTVLFKRERGKCLPAMDSTSAERGHACSAVTLCINFAVVFFEHFEGKRGRGSGDRERERGMQAEEA